MSRYFCDLHIHSCLSPCADDDMTPGNICGMAAINGLQIVALTDHNTTGNCTSFFAAAKALGLIPVPGMELTTAEDIHLVCLFRDLAAAAIFDEYVTAHRMEMENRPDIFGNQLLIGEEDEVIGEERNLLLYASDITLEEAYEQVKSLHGACYPAHIDRQSNGIVSILGDFPPEPKFTAYELNDGASKDAYLARCRVLEGLCNTVSSDAHHLWDISEADFAMELDDEPYSSALVRNRLIDYLSGVQNNG